jgi:hypothetical protein
MFTDIVHLHENRRKTGAQYAIRILIGSTVAWLVLHSVGHHDPLWAIISVIMVSEPELGSAVVAFRWRVLNTVVGCAVGVLFMWATGPQIWSILVAMVACVLICTWVMDAPTGWRIGPDQHRDCDDARRPAAQPADGDAGGAAAHQCCALAGSAIAVIVAWLLDVLLPKLKPRRRSS